MFCPNFKICMGCFVHVILLGVGCFVSLQKNMWWFLSTYNKMDMGGYVRGVFCPYTKKTQTRSRTKIIMGNVKLFFTRKKFSLHVGPVSHQLYSLLYVLSDCIIYSSQLFCRTASAFIRRAFKKFAEKCHHILIL